MTIGTKSLLFGAHQFLLHPLCVAVAWFRLYGWSKVVISGPADRGHRGWTKMTSIKDPRLWFAFFLHDVGYAGRTDMDGESGKSHPASGARIMGALFGPEWEWFTLRHSRSYASSLGVRISQLCVADKLATAVVPIWLYLPMVKATGEIDEYKSNSKMSEFGDEAWATVMRSECERWATSYVSTGHAWVKI